MPNVAPHQRLLLTPNEAAEAIGVSRAKLYNMLRAGEIPSVRLGGMLRVPVDALRALIARETAGVDVDDLHGTAA